MAEQEDVGFQSVQILKENSLGTGSYGTVYKAKCDDLLCAVKVLHYFSSEEESSSLFEQECRSLHTLRHPNLVQYLGTWKDPSTNLPVLVMELMDENLTRFLERNLETLLPLHTQVNICHDIALALSFLHSNGIIHRDLSSNNVLMMGDRRAKVADFGMTKLCESCNSLGSLGSPRKSKAEVEAYMPPELTAKGQVCTEKLDCFSYGVLVLQVLTMLPPQPGNQFKMVFVSDPNFPDGIETRATEVERRKEHIDMVSSDSLLLQVALECLKDRAEERPLARDLCQKVEELKASSKYKESLNSSDTDRLISNIKQQKDMQLLSQASTEVTSQTGVTSADSAGPKSATSGGNRADEVEALMLKVKMLEDEQEKVREASEAVETELRKQVKEQETTLQANEEEILALKKQLEEMGRNQVTRKQRMVDLDGMEPRSISLTWRRQLQAPQAMSRTCEAIVTTEKFLYLRPTGSKHVFMYNVNTKCWTSLPDVSLEDCGLSIVKHKLTTFGGKVGSDGFSNQLLSLVQVSGRKKWTELHPPMSVKRCNTIIVNCKTSCVVAGGEGEEGYLRTVEVLDTDTVTWFRVADLPDPLVYASATQCGSYLYLIGGWVEKMTPTYMTLCCSLDDLLRSKHTSKPDMDSSTPSSNSPWCKIAALGIKSTTCVSIKGRLVTVGGRDIHKPTTAINVYNPVSDSWEVLTHMVHARHQCFVAALDSKLVVIGGWVLNDRQLLEETDAVEVANIV